MATQEAVASGQATDGRIVDTEWAAGQVSGLEHTARAVREAVAAALHEAAETHTAVEKQATALLQHLEEASQQAQAEVEQAHRARQALEVELRQRRAEAEERMRQLVEETEARCAAALQEAEERRTHLLGEVAALQDQVAQIQKITAGLLDTRLSSLREAVHSSPH